MLWEKKYIVDEKGVGGGIVIAKNGDYIIGGTRASSPWVLRLDSLGNIKWATWLFDSTKLEASPLSRSATINYLRETSRGTIVCAAGDPYPNNDGSTLNDYAAYLEFDSLGTLKRNREWKNISNYEIGGFSIEETEGGNYVFGGNEAVFYLDSTGKATWKANYTFDLNGVGSEVSEVYRVKVLRNNTPFVMGKAYEANCWADYEKLYYDGWWSPISYESGLNSNWDTAGKQGASDDLYDFTQLNNGNLVFVGNRGGGNGDYPVWVIVTDSVGKKQYFKKEFNLSRDPGFVPNIFPMSVIATPDSGFTLVGWGYTDTLTGKNAFAMHYVPKDPTAVINKYQSNTKSECAINTRISRTKLTIESDATGNNKSAASLFDLSGRCVAVKTGSNRIIMDISHISQGTYLLKVKSNNIVRTQKIFIKN
jgi:hypothetical protein